MNADAVLDMDVASRLGAFALEAKITAGPGVTALFGASGAGKTTIINMIAGLSRPDRGRIALGGRVLVDTEARIFVPPHRRGIGLVYQDAQLFPHLTVRQNLMFGRWFARNSPNLISMEDVCGTLGIGDLMARRPARLSGGERQRVALARALLSAPKMLLMDEPLASLDAVRKAGILALISRIRDNFHVPMVYVSHSADEVRALADRVIVLKDGRVVADGRPDSVL